MASQEIRINELIKKFTHGVIYNSTYEILKGHLLARQALSEVVKGIEAHVTEQSAKDQRTFVEQATLDACQSQKTSDQQELDRDLAESAQDTVLELDYQTEFNKLEQELPYLEARFESQQQELVRLHRQYPVLKHNLSFNNYNQKRNQTASALVDPQVEHANLEIAIPAQVDTLASEIEQAKKQHEATIMQLTQLRKVLDLKQSRFKELEAELAEFPNKKRERDSRSQERTQRAAAREVADPQLNQLSLQSKELLNKQILASEQEKSKLNQEIMAKVQERSYQAYLEQLKTAEHLPVSPIEHGELGYIISDMEEYLKMEAAEKALLSSLAEKQKQQTEIKRQFSQHQEELTDSNTNLPKLLAGRDSLLKKVMPLQQERALEQEAKENFKWPALVSGGSAIFAYFLTALLVNTLILAPVLWILPVVLAVASVFCLVGALNSYSNQTYVEAKITANDLGIETLTSEIHRLNNSACELQDKIIPDLGREMSHLDVLIAQDKVSLEDLRKSMEYRLRQANLVGTYYVSFNNNNNTFFANTTGPEDTQVPPPSLAQKLPNFADPAQDGASTGYEEVPPPFGVAP